MIESAWNTGKGGSRSDTKSLPALGQSSALSGSRHPTPGNEGLALVSLEAFPPGCRDIQRMAQVPLFSSWGVDAEALGTGCCPYSGYGAEVVSELKG